MLHFIAHTLRKRLVTIAFANIYLIWGSTFLAMTYGLRGFPPFILSGIRFVVAGLILYAWRSSKGEKTPSLKDWRNSAVTAALILTGGTGLVAWGEQYVTATEAAIAIATGPFWFIVIDKANWKKYFSKWSIIAGLITGFAGLVIFLKGSVSLEGGTKDASLKTLAFVVLGLSSVLWVLGSLYSRSHKRNTSTVMGIAMQLLMGGTISLLIASLRGEWKQFSPAHVPAVSWIALCFLVLFGSVIAYLSYIWLLSVRPPALVSTHTYINPVVAVIVGWLFLKQTISSLQLAGLAVILTGVVLTNSANYAPRPRTRVRVRQKIRHSTHAVASLFIPS